MQVDRRECHKRFPKVLALSTLIASCLVTLVLSVMGESIEADYGKRHASQKCVEANKVKTIDECIVVIVSSRLKYDEADTLLSGLGFEVYMAPSAVIEEDLLNMPSAPWGAISAALAVKTGKSMHTLVIYLSSGGEVMQIIKIGDHSRLPSTDSAVAIEPVRPGF